MYLHRSLSLYISIYLYISLYIYLSIYLYLYLSLSLYIYIYIYSICHIARVAGRRARTGSRLAPRRPVRQICCGRRRIKPETSGQY